MKQDNYKYDKSDIAKVYETAMIADHVPDVHRVGRYDWIKCPFCGEFGKRKSKMHGMKLVDAGIRHFGKCFDCGQSLGSAVDAEEYFGQCTKLEAIERCARDAGMTIEPIADRRKRLARESSERNKDSFVERQLRASGLTFDDVMAKVNGKNGEKEFAPVFIKGSVGPSGKINPNDDEMLIRYYDLFGDPVTYATRRDGTGVKPYIRTRWSIPEDHTDLSGKSIKYQTPKGAPARFYIPQKIRDYYDSKSKIETLIVQEGEKKAEKACKHGIPSIAIQGIYNIGSAQTGLMKELGYIVRQCEVKNVVLLFDSDWDTLTSKLENGAKVDQRPRQFSGAAIKFKNYVQSLHNEGLHVDIWFGHLNSKEEKGIDDLLAGSLKKKEEALSLAIDEAMHAHDGHSELVDFHKISTLTDYQIRDFWALNKFEEFASRHTEELAPLDVFNFSNTFYAKTDSGEFSPQTATGDSAEFWSVECDDNGKESIKFDPIGMIRFLEANGFRTIKTIITGEGVLDLVRVVDGVLYKSSIVEIKRYILSFVSKVAPRNVHAKLLDDFGKIVTPDKCYSLTEIEDTTAMPESTRQTFCYKSGFVTVTPDDVICNAPGLLMWDKSIIKRNFKRIPIVEKFDYTGKYFISFTPEAQKCEFLKYLQLTSDFWYKEGEDAYRQHREEWELHIINKMSCLGFLLHFYRPFNEQKAVVAMDQTETPVGTSNGRSGKSILGIAIEQIIPQAYVDGKNFDPKFMFSGVKPETRNVFIDDIHPSFKFEDLYSAITSKMMVNIKQGAIFEISREIAPKILITTNHAIRSDSPSTDARKILISYSDFFNVERSVADYFGHCFFSEWDDDQWLLFDNFMIDCVQLYLKVKYYGLNPSGKNEGLVPPPMADLRRRELRQRMGEGFLEWAQGTFDPARDLNRRRQRKELYAEYQAFDKTGGRFCNSFEFKKRIVGYCEYSGLHFNPRKKHFKTGEDFADWIRLNPGGSFIGQPDKADGVEYMTISQSPSSTDSRPIRVADIMEAFKPPTIDDEPDF